MSRIDGNHCDGIVISTNTTFAYIIANDHYYDKACPPALRAGVQTYLRINLNEI